MFNDLKDTQKYTILKYEIMSKKFSIGLYTGGVKIDEWDSLTKHQKTIALKKIGICTEGLEIQKQHYLKDVKT